MTAAPRIAAIDALRGFALIGIYFFNILVMGGPIDSESPAAAASLADPDWQVWWLDGLFVRGAMRGLFSLLFGASTLLFLRQETRNGAYLRRCFWLFLFGVVNSTLLLWPGDILIIYALAGPILLLFRDAKPRTLLLAAAAATLVLSAWQYQGALGAGAGGPPDISAEQAARLGDLRREPCLHLEQIARMDARRLDPALGSRCLGLHADRHGALSPERAERAGAGAFL